MNRLIGIACCGCFGAGVLLGHQLFPTRSKHDDETLPKTKASHEVRSGNSKSIARMLRLKATSQLLLTPAQDAELQRMSRAELWQALECAREWLEEREGASPGEIPWVAKERHDADQRIVSRVIWTVGGELGRRDWTLFLEEVEEIKDKKVRNRLLRSALYQQVRLDPLAAIPLFEDIEKRYSSPVGRFPSTGTTTAAALGAETFADFALAAPKPGSLSDVSFPEEFEFEVLMSDERIALGTRSNLVGHWAARDPEAAMRFLSALPEGSDPRTSSLFSGLEAGQGTTEAAHLTAGYLASMDATQRGFELRSLGYSMRRNFFQLDAMLAALPAPEERRALLQPAIAQVSTARLDWSLNLLQRLPSTAERIEVFQRGPHSSDRDWRNASPGALRRLEDALQDWGSPPEEITATLELWTAPE